MKGAMHMLLALLAIGACSVQGTTIASVASGVPDLSTLVQAVSVCPPVLAAATDNTTVVTVFAPTNEAFATYLTRMNMTAGELLANTTTLCALLERHIVPGVITASQAQNYTTVLTTMSGVTTTIQLFGGYVFVNNAKVVTADVHAGASIVHVIDAVISTTPTIASVAGMLPGTLAAGLTLAPIVPEFLAAVTNPDTAVTAFIPTDGAWLNGLAKLAYELNTTTDDIMTNHDFLLAMFSYHVSYVVFNTNELVGDNELRLGTLLPKAHISVQRHHGIVLVNQYTRVVIENVKAGNSMIQYINKLQLPTNWASYYKGPASGKRMAARRSLKGGL